MKTSNNLMSVREVRLKYIPDSGLLKSKKITSAHDACMQLLEGYDKDTIGMQEQFVVLLLNRANKGLGIYKVSTGGITGVMVDIRLVMVAALKSLASGIIISHNHPSSNMVPSIQDVELTARIDKACKLLDIELLDHIIVTSSHSFYSFANEGLMSQLHAN
jgi:DNA repair protein RadC